MSGRFEVQLRYSVRMLYCDWLIDFTVLINFLVMTFGVGPLIGLLLYKQDVFVEIEMRFCGKFACCWAIKIELIVLYFKR